MFTKFRVPATASQLLSLVVFLHLFLDVVLGAGYLSTFLPPSGFRQPNSLEYLRGPYVVVIGGWLISGHADIQYLALTLLNLRPLTSIFKANFWQYFASDTMWMSPTDDCVETEFYEHSITQSYLSRILIWAISSKESCFNKG